MLEIKDSTKFENLLEKYEMLVLVFYAKWCEKGKSVTTKIQEIEKQYSSLYQDRLHFLKAEVDSAPQIKEKYQIISLPTILIIKNKVVQRKFLMWSEENIIKNIDTNLLTKKIIEND